ncbi:MAG: LptE family protein [Pirellulales bacterium]|nr:LptE family protein [Pirellulales bacterium]
MLILVFSGCAAYQIGNETLYPQGIRTVYVPMFESGSFRPYLGERLTEAVMKEIEAKTNYKVVSDCDQADSVLSGRIIGETKNVLIYSLSGDPRQLQSQLRVTVSWVDRRGRVLRDGHVVPLPNELTDVSGTGNFVPELGQSGATSQQEAINRVAQQIVGLMENPW